MAVIRVTDTPLIKYWDYEKNTVKPETVAISNSKTFFWWFDAECGHSWEALAKTINSHWNKPGQPVCNYCHKRGLILGLTDLATTHPDIFSQLHSTLNQAADLLTLTKGSHKKLWWFCSLNHVYEAPVDKRTSGKGCPYCASKKVLIGFNDAQTFYPHLVDEWHPTKNLFLLNEYIKTSEKKVWWMGKCGHQYEMSIRNKGLLKHRCPICANKTVLPGFNDLATLNPAKAAMWHPTKNRKLKPTDISSGSDYKAWWICNKGHEWDSCVYRKTSCPKCWASSQTSKQEQELQNYIKELLSNDKVITSERLLLKGKELDIYIPSLKIGIEYNGLYWHSEASGTAKNSHHNKWLEAKNLGIELVQIWEDQWVKNKEQVKLTLRHKLLSSENEKLSIKNYDICEINFSEAQQFLNAHDIEGYNQGDICFAIKENKMLIATLVLKQEPKESRVFNITHYATSIPITAGFTTLLNYAEKFLNVKRFTVISDNCMSYAKLYETNGFKIEEEFPPDYRYVYKNMRTDKSEYTLERFKADPNLIYEKELTIDELAVMNKIHRIWDAGKALWIKEIT